MPTFEQFIQEFTFRTSRLGRVNWYRQTSADL